MEVTSPLERVEPAQSCEVDNRLAVLLALLLGTRGPITARGGLFWKTWNEAREAQSCKGVLGRFQDR